ncbi:AcrR family transcriptional regulator [Motilibacter peucedani]|uniref:AcrR family transcriptional regulator n=1 Tax=Motilibacter peucedani TaxID=598650 RepID=A0A420XU88_9ACTN|nr:TetR/AcrR family transcriptional regulator [Motilibacter peucedani]RKS80327.1 AcrR family transcriptional regulator [Motilibacter peucedani]
MTVLSAPPTTVDGPPAALSDTSPCAQLDARERELCTVALDLLAETGYEALSMDALAKRARASKATIYRRWSNKAELIVDALRLVGDCGFVVPDTGSLRDDLLEAARAFGTVAASRSGLFASVAHATKTDERLCTAVRERLTEPRRRVMVEIVERAVARGELPAGAARLPLAHDLLPALLMARLAMRQPVDESFVLDLVDTVLLPVLRQPVLEQQP